MSDLQDIGRGAVAMLAHPAGWVAIALIAGFVFLAVRRSRRD